jgi:hypothetical protein
MKLIFSYLCGFTSACLLFYLYGELTLDNYWYFLLLAVEVLTIPFLINGLVRNRKQPIR